MILAAAAQPPVLELALADAIQAIILMHVSVSKSLWSDINVRYIKIKYRDRAAIW